MKSFQLSANYPKNTFVSNKKTYTLHSHTNVFLRHVVVHIAAQQQTRLCSLASQHVPMKNNKRGFAAWQIGKFLFCPKLASVQAFSVLERLFSLANKRLFSLCGGCAQRQPAPQPSVAAAAGCCCWAQQSEAALLSCCFFSCACTFKKISRASTSVSSA